MEHEVAKDITQETFILLWENRRKVVHEKARSWLFTTAYRLAIMHTRSRNRFSGEFRPDFVEADTNFDLLKIVEESLTLLSDIQKSILLLRDMEGYSYEEIAEILQISDAQVKVYLFRARTKIKDYIRDLKYVL